MASILQSIKVNGAVAASLTGQTNGTFTLYTAPATGYAIVNIIVTIGGGITVKVGGTQAMLAGATEARTLYVGPSQAVQAVLSSAGAGAITAVSGVEFINTT